MTDWKNTTADSMNLSAGTGVLPLLGLMFLIVAAFLVIALGTQWGARFFKAGSLGARVLRRLFTLFAYGAAAMLAIGAAVAPVYAVSRIDAETQTEIVKWAAVSVAGFFGVAGFGWFVERWWKRLQANRAEVQQERELEKHLAKAGSDSE